MIAPIDQPLKKQRRPVEIRLVLEIQMPPWMQNQPNVIRQEISGAMHNQRISPEFVFTAPPQMDVDPVISHSAAQPSKPPATPLAPEKPIAQDDSGQPSESLVDLYREHLEPRELLKNEPRTVRADITRVQNFQNWLEMENPNVFSAQRITTPRGAHLRIVAENKDILFDYSRWMRNQDSGNSAATVMHSMNAVMKLFRWCAEAGLLKKAPKYPTKGDLNEMRPESDSDDCEFQGEPVTVEEFRRMSAPEVLACCEWPRLGNISPATFWETVLLSHMVFGFRSQDWFAARTNDKTGLLWSDLITETQCPRLEDLHNPHGWLWYLVHKTKKKSKRAAKPTRLLVPLPSRLRELIEMFRGLDPVRVFPLQNNSRYWSAEFQGILLRAGLDRETRKAAKKPEIQLSLGQKKIASFRKGCASMWADHCCEEAASYLLQHSVSDGKVSAITREHYLKIYRPLRRIVPALETLPVW